MKSKSAYPWFYFLRIARLSLLVFLPTLILLIVLFRSASPAADDAIIFTKILPLSLLSYIIFLVLFYRATRPLGIILSKVEKFQVDVPFQKTIRLLYMKDKWTQIEEALNEAENKLIVQTNKTRLENEKISTILESINDDIIAIDPFETVLFTNTNFDRNFVRGRSLGEILPKLWHLFSDEEILGAFRDVLKTGERTNIKGMTLLPNRFFDLTVTALRDPSGKVVGALGVFYDVTEFKLTEQMRVDFVANVSHEIRTPLTSIKGYTQVLQSQKAKIPEELSSFMDKILMNTERMISLFNDLLNLSVIESKFQLKKEELDLPELVASIAANISTNYPDRKVNFEYDLALPVIKGDPRLMEQVLSNLFDNACKYSEKGQVILIHVKSRKQDGKAILSVCDNGPGISPEHIQRIFERFYRIESSREVSRGTGLGLSIVKHIISRHEGRIWAESQGERGSTFVIELPLE